jgi:hypothetical protein
LDEDLRKIWCVPHYWGWLYSLHFRQWWTLIHFTNVW